MSAARSSLRSGGVALAALLRRDLSAGRRGATLAGARLVVVGLSGLVAILALGSAATLYGHPAEAGAVGWSLLWILAAFSLLMLPVLSLQAMRQDRASGTLELLLLAGLSLRLLAFGRWLSSFVLLESLLLDTLPALAVFAFFGTPSLGGLGWGVLALTGWNASLAGLAVFYSSTFKRTGPGLFTAIGTIVVIVVLSAWWLDGSSSPAQLQSVPPSPPVLLAELTWRGVVGLQVGPLDPLRHLGGLLAFVGLGGLLALWSGERLTVQSRPRAPKAKPPNPLRALAGVKRPNRMGRLPLTWLLQRGAPATRPLALALALPLPLLALGASFEWMRSRGETSISWTDLLDPSALYSTATIYWAVGLLLALLASAVQVARLRERKEWDSLLATGRSGRAILLDLLAGPGLAAGIALGIAAILFAAGVVGALAEGHEAGLAFLLGTLGAILASGVLMLILGLLAGLAARTQAGALGLSILLLLAAGTLGAVGASLLGQSMLGLGFDTESRVSLVALAAALSVPLQLQLLSGSRRRPGGMRLFFEVTLCGALLVPALFHGLAHPQSPEETVWMSALAFAALGLPLLVVTLRRPNYWLGRTG